jgi:hypothetical protein
MSLPKHAFLSAALLWSGLLGCGGMVEVTNSTDGTAGTGGTGGTAGAGGTGGTAGAGGDICSDDLQAVAYQEPPPLGFESAPSKSMTAVVVSVTATSLQLSLGPDGSLETFTWEGPALTDYFAQGDTVTAGASEGWQYVAANVIAAVHVDYQFVPPDVLPAVPMTKGPALGYASQCHFTEAGGGCGQPPGSVHVLAVTAGSGPGSIEVGFGETAAAGPHTVHNAGSSSLPGYGGDDCAVEALFFTGITVVGPVGK